MRHLVIIAFLLVAGCIETTVNTYEYNPELTHQAQRVRATERSREAP